jgi:hypothetical protein
MSGPPYSYADATFSLTVTGDGRSDKYTYRPVSPQSFVAWAPPGALNASSLAARSRISAVAGDNTIVVGASLADLAPWTASYVIVIPPANSKVWKIMKGNTDDIGIVLVPWLPNIIALPSDPSGLVLIYNLALAEDLDLIVI